MFLRFRFAFDLDRLPWLGLGMLGLAIFPAFFCLTTKHHPCNVSVEPTQVREETFTVHWPLKEGILPLSADGVEAQIAFSVDPPRPSADVVTSRLIVWLSGSKQMKRIEVPAKLDLEFKGSGTLCFSQSPSLFWLDIDAHNHACLWVTDQSGFQKEISRWTIVPQETPILPIEEFAVGSPFYQLAESRLLGQDLFQFNCGNGSSVYRIELSGGLHVLNVPSNGWLTYRDGKWEASSNLPNDGQAPIARIWTLVGARGAEMEGWDGASHLRFVLPQASPAALKMKGEDLFSQIRVRSEKQISCTLDKQCLILRPGDWVLKLDQRWKLLRKHEEKEAFLNGEINGELFVLDRIDAKGALKAISGRYFSASRAQMNVIDYAVPNARTMRQSKMSEHLKNRGRK